MAKGGILKMYCIKKLGIQEKLIVKELFKSVFTAEPWNDDWSDEKQLDLYMTDLMGQSNSLTYGFFEDEELLGVSIGRIRHWFSGTEYNIDELFIKTEKQGNGLGTYFIKEIEKEVKKIGISIIFLQTESTVPAFDFYRKNRYNELKTHVSFAKLL